MKNKIFGYRRMLGLTQKEMAIQFQISLHGYWQKENGRIPFSDKEKQKFKDLLKPIFPDITIDEIFFN